MPLTAAIFDWDGVVIDSSRHHEESWERLAAEIAKPLPADHFKKGFGMKNEFIIPNLLDWTHDPAEIQTLSLRKEALYREVVRDWGIEPLPGVVDLLQTLHGAGIPCAVGSSTHRENITTILETIGMRRSFEALVTAEDVSHGKPDPEVFLAAAEKLGAPPEHCVVFEDALVGIEAGHKAGMKVVGVATTNSADLIAHADACVHRLTEVSLETLRALF